MQGQTIVSSSNKVVGYLYQKQNEVVYYFQLKQMNDSLMNDQSILLQQLANDYATDTFHNMLTHIPDTILPPYPMEYDTTIVKTEEKGDSLVLKPIEATKVIVTYSDYEFIPVRVIKNSITQSHINYITLNRGKSAGIEEGMPVVTANGIVGRVTNVSENFATVASVLSNRKIHARMENGTPGFVFWEGKDPSLIRMDNLPLLDSIPLGSKVYTSGYSYFPENILIGTVHKVDTIENTNSQTLNIALSTNFRTLQYAYVVKNRKGAEKLRLEQKTKAE